MKAPLYNQEGTKIGVLELPDKLFGVRWNPTLVHDVLLALRSSRRRATAHAKGRGEVRGGGRKQWKQKGTGRARVGSSRSPLWKGGGITFGPTNERNFSKKINKKMKRGALLSLLSKRWKDGEIKIIDAFAISEPKTKHMVAIMNTVITHEGKTLPSALLVTKTGNKGVLQAARNIPKSKTIYPGGMNIYDCASKKVVLFEKEAVEEF